MEILKDKHKRKSLISSLLIHLALLIAFAFLGMTYMIPPPPEEGITINFGTSDQGMFDNPVDVPNDNPEVTESVVEDTQVEEVESTEDVITQETEEAPAIKKEEKEEVKKVDEPVKEEPKPNKQLNAALNKLQNISKEQGGGDGESNESGDQGALDGDPNSNNYTGGGIGNGTSANVAGRNMLSSPKITDNSQDEGKVVVDIIVDKYGNVIRATPGARGSNTTSPILYKKAKEAALKTKFNASTNAADEQKGQMTFIFILN